jgi:hypothetical protein
MNNSPSRIQIVVVAALATGVVLLALVGAAWACFATGNPNANPAATANAVSTNVQATLIAQGTLPPPSTTVIENTPVATQPPIVVPSATTAPSTPFQPATLTATLAPLSRNNGELVVAARAETRTIDGNSNDWGELPRSANNIVFRSENWTGASDLSARFSAAWNTDFLFIFVQVTDDAHVQTQTGELLFRGDSVEILFDANLRQDFNNPDLTADDAQLGLSPGALNGDAASSYLWFPATRKGLPSGVQVAALRTDLGYNLEAAIPWNVLGAQPAAGERYGFALSISDNDAANSAAQETMSSSVPARRLTDPTTWGTLELGQ